MENELKGIKYILFLIALVLLFGAGAVREAAGTIFWILMAIGVIVLILIGLGAMAGDRQKPQSKKEEKKLSEEEKRQYEEEDRIYFEETHPGWKRKKFLGSTVDMNKVDYGNWGVTILIIVSLFILMVVIGVISSRF